MCSSILCILLVVLHKLNDASAKVPQYRSQRLQCLLGRHALVLELGLQQLIDCINETDIDLQNAARNGEHLHQFGRESLVDVHVADDGRIETSLGALESGEQLPAARCETADCRIDAVLRVRRIERFDRLRGCIDGISNGIRPLLRQRSQPSGRTGGNLLRNIDESRAVHIAGDALERVVDGIVSGGRLQLREQRFGNDELLHNDIGLVGNR